MSYALHVYSKQYIYIQHTLQSPVTEKFKIKEGNSLIITK